MTGQLFDQQMTALTVDEMAAVLGMASWLPRAYPLHAGQEHMTPERYQLSVQVHQACAAALRMMHGAQDIQALHAVADVAAAYLRAVPADSQLRQTVSLSVIESALSKLSEGVNRG